MKPASLTDEVGFVAQRSYIHFLGHYCAFSMQYYSLAKSLFFSFIFFLNKSVNS